jgi:hypothetical protein
MTLDEETLELFTRTVRAALSAGHPDEDRTAALVDSGWRDVLAVDPPAAIRLVFRLHGELRARSAVLDDVARAAVRRDGAGDDEDALGTAAFVHPLGAPVAARSSADELVIDGVALRRPLDGERVAAVARGDDDTALVVLVPAATLRCAPVAGLDPSLALVRVTGTVPAADAARLRVPVPRGAPGSAETEAIVDAACRRAVAYELIGLASSMLQMAGDYSASRTQFGQPIGVFQAVKHRLADVLVAVRAAEVVADETWNLARGTEAWLGIAAAKCLAGRAARLASENCLQVLGAIGFTAEHDLSRLIVRATVLDRLYGSARELRPVIGRALAERGEMPRLGVP